jgi:hypothetical protein
VLYDGSCLPFKKAGEADFDLFAILCSREETALEAIV